VARAGAGAGRAGADEPVTTRIDSHQHFWKYDPRAYDWIDERMSVLKRDFLPADLEPRLKAAGFDACVTVQARQTLDETAWLLELADRSPFVVGVVGWVDLCSPDARAQLERFATHPKLVGVRHIVQGEPDDRFLLRADFGRGIALLEEFGLAYDILIYPRHLAVAAEFVKRFPRQRFVLDHLAKPEIARVRSAAGPETCARWRRSPTCTLSSRASSPRRIGRGGRRTSSVRTSTWPSRASAPAA